MITYDQDPDVIRWGLELFDGDPYSNFGYCGSISQHNTDCYPGQYLKGYQYEADCNYAGDQNLNVDSLHEQLSQEHQTSFCSQDWFPHSLGNYNYVVDGYNGQHEEETVLGIPASCCSPGDELYCEEEWSSSLELMDEHAFDGEVGKRLNQMVSIPHIPKINGEIPSVDEATLDHQRLLDRLQVYELVEFKVQGDGNCQFRALSDQFYRTPEHHKFVREQIVNQLRSLPEIYEGYVPMAYDQYLIKMKKNGEWGDHVTLQAAADSYGIKIFVITSFKDTCYIEILPNIQKSERVIFLSFWSEVHYNSIYPAGDCPRFRTKKKKKRWQAAQHEHVESPEDYN
ncbi:OVARIAN TUMOR DOMAIN-containing deubiquitinating enzyme 12-like [Salvia splendens]|uniref:OVARIAN TUMOR DOMAIN-containing deubiquitinating enzyme 12-like n=1 Tax=Salvia splendens TaxID=180675 RepID=UPI001C25EE34|nr:OVARIAN TUMOR DOMAIN-containing deubiquitinating enzyme 12-like [Salvia splendens]